VNAKKAGFDGVQLHGANGYLPHQFLDPSSNHRTDQWGGSIENRCRFMLAAIDALIEAFGADRVGLKLSPAGGYNDMGFPRNETLATFLYLIEELNKRKIAFIEFHRYHPSLGNASRATLDLDVVTEIAPLFKGAIFLNGGYDAVEGATSIERGDAHAITYGRPFLANPDLPYRYLHNIPLNPHEPSTLYPNSQENKAHGYTDYPFARA